MYAVLHDQLPVNEYVVPSLDVRSLSVLDMDIAPMWMVHVYVTRYCMHCFVLRLSKRAVFVGLDWCGM